MSKHASHRSAQKSELHATLDRVLFLFSTYALFIAIAVGSLAALFFWNSFYPTPDAKQLSVRFIPDESASLSPLQALAKLENRDGVPHFDTKLSESPFWFAFTVKADKPTDGVAVELPSRHTMEVSCWSTQPVRLLGSGDRIKTAGAMDSTKAGFSLSLGRIATDQQVLCRATSVGPAHLTVVQWPASQFVVASEEFHRNSGLLDGGLIVLALFVLVTALINRESIYLLFAVWLIVNLRLGALSAGWDAQWLGRSVPQEWLLSGRLFTTAVYYVVTVTLFKALFREDLAKVGYGSMLRFTQFTCLPLLLLSVVLPYKTYLPFLWTFTGLSIGVLVFYLLRIIVKTRSQVAMWYGASIAITLFASLYEVLSAALGFKGMIGAVNSVTAALASSLLASLAIAAQMRQEHQQRLAAQAELQHTFDVMPIGLFTLDLRGQFMSANPALLKMLGEGVMERGKNTWQRYFSGGAWTQLHHLVHTQTDGELELRGRSTLLGGGEPARFLVKATLARDKIEGSLQDVTAKSQATENLLFLANNDPLTRVFNRRGIETALGDAIAELADGKPVALAYLDLDRFKLINDLYGHSAGDAVLQQVCERVQSMISGSVQFGRVGGDEFVLVLADTKIPAARQICRGIVESIGDTVFQIGERAFHVRGSVGLIEVSPGMKVKDAVSAADRACREAKAGNSDGLVVYERNAKAFQQHEAELKLVELLASKTATDG